MITYSYTDRVDYTNQMCHLEILHSSNIKGLRVARWLLLYPHKEDVKWLSYENSTDILSDH